MLVVCMELASDLSVPLIPPFARHPLQHTHKHTKMHTYKQTGHKQRSTAKTEKCYGNYTHNKSDIYSFCVISLYILISADTPTHTFIHIEMRPKNCRGLYYEAVSEFTLAGKWTSKRHAHTFFMIDLTSALNNGSELYELKNHKITTFLLIRLFLLWTDSSNQ